MRASGVLIALVALTLSVTVFVAVNQGSPGGEGSSDERLAAIEKRLDGMESMLRDVRETSRSVKRRVESAPRGTAASGGAAAVAGGADSALLAGDETRAAAFENEVATRLETAVEEQMERLAARQRYRSEDGKWKPPMSEITREFGLNEDQEDSLREVFNSARDEGFALLSERRLDGTDVLSDFAADIKKSGDFRGAIGRFFGRLAKDKVPGREQTYLQAFGEIEERVRARAESHLDEKGRQHFRDMNVDVFEVDTGHDPIGDHIRERIAETE